MRDFDDSRHNKYLWEYTYEYADDLVKSGILSQEEVAYKLSMFKGSESNEAYDWLINEASKVQVNKLLSEVEDDDIDNDITVSPFLNREKDVEFTDELNELLENTYIDKRLIDDIKRMNLKRTATKLGGALITIVGAQSLSSAINEKLGYSHGSTGVGVFGALAIVVGIAMVSDYKPNKS